MSRRAISIACIVCLCLAGVTGTVAAVSDAPAGGADGSVDADQLGIAVNETDNNETDDNETSTPIGIGLGPVRVTEVSLTDREITVGEQTAVVATVQNRGDEPGAVTVTASAGEIEIGERRVQVDPGETRELRFTYRPEKPGEYLILVNGRSPGVLTVNRVEQETTVDVAGEYVGWSGLVLGSVGLLTAVVLSALVAIGRSPRIGAVELSVRTAEQLWVLGSALLLVGIVAGSGLPVRGAQFGAIAVVAYAIYAVLAVIYRSGT